MHTSQTAVPGLRLAELLASLSLTIDLGLGQPMEHFLRACLLAVRLGELLDLSEQERSEVYYLGLIRHLGCTAGASEVAAVQRSPSQDGQHPALFGGGPLGQIERLVEGSTGASASAPAM